MRIPYGFDLTSIGTLEIKENEAETVRMIFDYYLVLSNSKYISIVGFEHFTDVQFEKSARCNVGYDKAGSPRRSTRYASPSMLQI